MCVIDNREYVTQQLENNYDWFEQFEICYLLKVIVAHNCSDFYISLRLNKHKGTC